MAKRKAVKTKTARRLKTLKTVIVRGSEWLRALTGRRTADSMLYNPTVRKMCCLGIACHAAGVEKKLLKNIITPGELKAMRLLVPFPGLVGPTSNSWLSNQMMEVNDDETTSDQEKVGALRPLGKRAGIRFVFKLDE